MWLIVVSIKSGYEYIYIYELLDELIKINFSISRLVT